MSENFHVLASETITGTTDPVDLLIEPRGGQGPSSGISAVVVQFDVTEVSGINPRLDMNIEESMDGENWFTFLVFSTRISTGNQIMRKSNPAQFVRASWIITGTNPSFTFALSFIRRT